MNLEAVQHLSGVPIYVISLLVVFQMWLLFVAIPDVHRAHMQWFAQFPEITGLLHATRYTSNNKPSNNLGSLQKRSDPFFLHSSDSSAQGWKNHSWNRGGVVGNDKNKTQ